jgi:hypothetical protein
MRSASPARCADDLAQRVVPPCTCGNSEDCALTSSPLMTFSTVPGRGRFDDLPHCDRMKSGLDRRGQGLRIPFLRAQWSGPGRQKRIVTVFQHFSCGDEIQRSWPVEV